MGGDSFERMWTSLSGVGRSARTGGYHRFAWTDADLECRAWFTEQALARGLDTAADRCGNLWAWWGADLPGPALAVGSHLDSVPDGGGYDGPLGVVSALAALDELRARAVTPRRPVAVVSFADEEGARFGVPCVGSRLLTGALDPERARGLRDAGGISLADAVSAAGLDPAALGPDPELVGRVGQFVELHVEQGRALAERDVPVGLASRIWPHGRWRLDFAGEANHAGTTRLADRRDAMLPAASSVLAAREAAGRLGAHATVGRLHATPGGTNAIAGHVSAWLDARAADEPTVRALVDAVAGHAAAVAAEHGVAVRVVEESWTPAVEFAHGPAGTVRPHDRPPGDRPGGLTGELAAALRPRFGDLPVLPTGAGHDAGILAGVMPAAMLFVRNPTGVSHAPAERAEPADCLAGVAALADVIEHLAGRA